MYTSKPFQAKGQHHQCLQMLFQPREKLQVEQGFVPCRDSRSYSNATLSGPNLDLLQNPYISRRYTLW